MFDILVIEDDPMIATELVGMLQMLGHAVRWETGPEYLALDHGLDLVLLDLGLGQRDGFEVLEQLAASGHAPPIVITSGHDRRIIDAARSLAIARGLTVIGTLPKPYVRADLEAMLALLSRSGGPPIMAANRPASSRDPSYVFQSKHDLNSGTVVGYEALLRLPGVDDIEQYFAGLEHDDALALTLSAATAAVDAQQQLARSGQVVTLAFNCPPDIFGDPDFLLALKDIVARTGMDPGLLAIELTEQQGNTAPVDLGSMASRYALAGFQVHMDDFGSGTASLAQLLQLPLREVKIDRKVFRSLSQEGKRLLFEIVAHCKAHGIASTIEGIETDAELSIARASGADFGQGYFWSRPARIDLFTPPAMAEGKTW